MSKFCKILVVSAIIIGSEVFGFITNSEYGAMLYKNPRGIGCDNCHAKNGSGSVIASYKDIKKGEVVNKELIAPDIRTISPQSLADAINEPKSIMPKYFLTVDEIWAIYYFLQSQNDINSTINKEQK
ncbi:MAG: cytochrome c [Campylobacter sp.]|nr:cytochrome c [Campylobacter sp.]